MKKTVLLSIFLIFTAVSSMAVVNYGLESCVRYGTDVLIMTIISRSTGMIALFWMQREMNI